MEERSSNGGDAAGRVGGGGGGPSSSRVRPSCVKLGGRQIFTVELRLGETTFVSWKKLVKDANKVNSGSAPAPVPPPANAHPSLESRIPTGQLSEKEVKDATPPNRFNAVIEKIERLYTGKDISDEEDLKDVPDDNQYDTEDSFIDDAELDEYFEVDGTAIKHDGFFVNRGKLEQIESTVVPNQQPKKRRIKDASKAPGESDDGHLSNKHARIELQDSAKPKAGLLQSKSLTEKLKDASGLSNGSHQRYLNKTAHPQTKMQSAKSMSGVDEHDLSVRSKEKNGVQELPDLNIPEAKNPMQEAKTSHIHKKDGSMVRPKSSMLEKAIGELEKMVMESRPPTWDNQEADTSSQAIKRRLPTEIKLKLAKVARLAQAIQGKISKELINRLMSILGHLIQLRTLKRNLKVMISMSLSSKQEKDDRFQQIKKEVVDMISTHVPSLESKVLEQQPVVSNDFQETGPQENGTLKRKFAMDAVLEDKICELYDLFVDGLDEDVGPQVKKLYVELARLWPSGLMDNHGIKHAICQAKERRRATCSRHKKTKRKKMLAPGMEETIWIDGGSMTLPQYSQESLPTDAGGPVLALASKQMPNLSSAAVWAPSSAVDASSMERLKHDKPKGSSSNFMDEVKMGADGALTKKKVKGKSEHELDETHLRLEKFHSQPSEERNKSIKQASGFNQKLNLQLVAPCREQSS